MMKKACFVLFAAIVALLLSAKTLTEFPQAEISNGIIHARFYLPDTSIGYYRGTRFDWSAVMPGLDYEGHSYCAQWFDNYAPTTHDAIIGPVESFSPLGYEDANAGGRFVQVGVGALSKPGTAAYSPFTHYPVLNYGSWKLKRKKRSIEFFHTLQDSLYSYEYKKVVRLVKDKPLLLLEHHLKNTGLQTIRTNVYNHNLFVMDGQPTGPGYTVAFPFSLSALADGQRNFGKDDIAALKDKQVIFNRVPGKKESAYAVLQGYGSNTSDYDIKIENHTTGAALRITSDRPLSKLVFWASARIFSPEPYIDLEIAPGESFNWLIAYEFYTCEITKQISPAADVDVRK